MMLIINDNQGDIFLTMTKKINDDNQFMMSTSVF